MKIVLPLVILDLIGDFSGDAKRKLIFSLTPKLQNISSYMWVAIREKKLIAGGAKLETRYRLTKNSWCACTLENDVKGLKEICNRYYATSSSEYHQNAAKLQKLCKVVYDYDLRYYYVGAKRYKFYNVKLLPPVISV